jgi:hypothetical protein
MIKQISWASYWSALVTISFFYYVIICFKFYSNEIKQILAGKAGLPFGLRVVPSAKDKRNEFADVSEEELFPLLNQLVQEIKMFLENGAERSLERRDVIYAIQLLLKKYPTIKGSAFESVVNNYIINECSNYCSIHLDEGEVRLLWLD